MCTDAVKSGTVRLAPDKTQLESTTSIADYIYKVHTLCNSHILSMNLSKKISIVNPKLSLKLVFVLMSVLKPQFFLGKNTTNFRPSSMGSSCSSLNIRQGEHSVYCVKCRGSEPNSCSSYKYSTPKNMDKNWVLLTLYIIN